jgi:predicted transcriptional regulator
MPRHPTGNPRGRPKGSGLIGEDQTRLTVRIPSDLYDRLEAFAEGRSFTRGSPQLAVCVREALAHYLICPDKRQTRNTTLDRWSDRRQTINGTGLSDQPIGAQSVSLPEKSTTLEIESREVIRQPENDQTPAQVCPQTRDDIRQTEKSAQCLTPALEYDPAKHLLGKLCPRRHDFQGSGHSVLRRTNRHCILCDREKFHERKQAKRQAQPA